jgi:hypothetical protein
MQGRAKAVLGLLGIAAGMLLLAAGSALAYWQTSDTVHAAAALGATLTAPTGGTQNGTATPSTIPVKWTAPAGPAPTGYIVLRCGTPSCTPSSSPSVGGCSSVITSVVTTLSCLDSDTSLAPNTTYTYAVEAVRYNWTSAPSATFTGVTTAISKLAFTAQPTSGQQITAAAGDLPSPLTVAVEDTAGATATNDNSGTITLSVASGPGSVTCTSPASLTANIASGLANFTGCAITKAGTYTLQATSTGLTTATSNSFSIVAGAAKQLAFTAQPTSGQQITAAAGDLPTLTVAVQDQFGNTLTTDSSTTVVLSIATGPGTITCTTPSSLSENDSSGLASYTGCAITKAGTYTLQATSTGLTTATSNSFSIVAGAAKQLAFTAQPTSGQQITAAAGDLPTPLKVAVQDQFGNTLTTDSGTTISLGVTGSAAPITCTTPSSLSENDSSGTANFTGCAITKAGTYTLQATSTGLTTATSNSFSIVAGTATKLAFTAQPSGSIPAAPADLGTVTVAVQDSFGNVVSSSGTSVTLAVTSSAAPITCSGGLTQSTSSGVSTFSGCAITLAGTYTLQATSTGLTTATSNSFTITAGPAAGLSFTNVTPALGSPVAITCTGTVGTSGYTCTVNNPSLLGAVSYTAQVTLIDQYQNVVTGTSLSVTVSSSGVLQPSGGPWTISSATGTSNAFTQLLSLGLANETATATLGSGTVQAKLVT